jgi:Asp/Glu/hydantoin racemase
MRIRLIIPITGLTGEGVEERLGYLREMADPGTEIDAVQVEVGPPAIESEADAVLAGPDVLRLVGEAERDGVDAAIIWCGGDRAVDGPWT